MNSGIEHLEVIGSLAPDNVNPSSIMGSSVLPEFFKWARENYDRVIIDSPPFGIVGDVMTLASLVDSVMIMCCPDRTHFKPIQHAARTLGESGATVIGVVVNDVEMGGSSGAFSPVGHSYGYNYGYGGYRAYGAYRPYGPLKSKDGKGGNKEKGSGDATSAEKPASSSAGSGKAPTAATADSKSDQHKQIRPEIADEA